ncbi:MAG: tetratricopeptide repeat protein [Gammaproteobacteria bacterium]|nr:tetratricopeptide repeat protein [Gammaproteobacteria bacterium]
MTMLFVLAAILLAITLWWLSRVFRVTAGQAVSSDRSDLEQLRDRLLNQLAELDAEQADRGIDSTLARDEELRLSAELAETLKQLETVNSGAVTPAMPLTRRARVGGAAILGLVLLGAGVGLYALQNVANLRGFLLAAEQGDTGKRMPPMVFDMVSKLEKRLAAQPNDAEGWARLGRSYAVLERADQARAAYAKSYELAPDNVEVLSEYAWLVLNQDPGNTTGLANELYVRLAKLSPQHPDALWFLGFAAYQKGDFRLALSYWERLHKLLSPEEPGRKHLQQAMDSARAKLKR